MQEEYITFILFGIVFIAVGIAILISVALSGRKVHRECTERVTAHCVRITNEADVVERAVSIGNEGNLNFGIKAPVFEILYNGQAIELKPHVYSNVCDTQVGEAREILIDPKNPQNYYDPKERRANFTLVTVIPALGLIVFGIMFLCIPVLGI